MSEARNIIYALHHPESRHVYVGKSSKGLERPRDHSDPYNLKRYAHLPRSKWIQSLFKRGFEPEIVVLEECARIEDLDEAERFHIASFRSLGIPLLNLTDGGDGVVGYKFTDESIAKMSATRKRRVEEIDGERERLTSLSDEYWANPEAREKKRSERRGKSWSPETRAKMSVAHEGKKKSPEARARMAEAAKKRWLVPGYKEKQQAAQAAAHGTDEARTRAAEWGAQSSHDTHHSPEYRKKLSEQLKEVCAQPEVKERKSKATTSLWQDPAYREKVKKAMSEGQQRRYAQERQDNLK